MSTASIILYGNRVITEYWRGFGGMQCARRNATFRGGPRSPLTRRFFYESAWWRATLSPSLGPAPPTWFDLRAATVIACVKIHSWLDLEALARFDNQEMRISGKWTVRGRKVRDMYVSVRGHACQSTGADVQWIPEFSGFFQWKCPVNSSNLLNRSFSQLIQWYFACVPPAMCDHLAYSLLQIVMFSSFHLILSSCFMDLSLSYIQSPLISHMVVSHDSLSPYVIYIHQEKF